MPLDKAKAGKLMSQLQTERDALEAAGDSESAAWLTDAIGGLLLAAGIATEPLMRGDLLEEEKRKAHTEANPKRREDAAARVAIETAKIELHRQINKLSRPRRRVLQKGI